MDEKKKEFNYLDDEEISLKQIFEILRKRAWIIVAITLTAIFITTSINFFLIKPVYESNTTIMVGKPRNRIVDDNNPITYQEIQTNRLLVSTYREIAKSRTVLEEVIKDLNLDISIGQLREKVDVTLVKDTEIIQIKVQDHDPETAANLANTIASAFSKQVIRIMNVENVQVLDEAIPQLSPVKPKKTMNIAISLVLGAMLGIFVAFILEFLDTSIKTPEDVEKYLGLPVIGTIPYLKEGES
ncbi:MAG: Wzz/FepE/Etk N-terminal domain-containing protein [Tepidanaerobacteraceae bacterium]